jgi:hypothetical protein
MKHFSDWHVAGWRAFVLAPIVLPIAILLQLLPLKKTRDMSAIEVATVLRRFIEKTGGEWDWDDFTSVPVTDPALEAIRAEANRIRLPVNEDGTAKLRELYERALKLHRER